MLNQIDIEKIKEIAKEAGDAIMEVYQQDFQIEIKADKSPLTEADIKANEIICRELKELYPNTRVIIDCTEIKTQQPSSLVLNSQMCSSYKSSYTFKCLLGIAPYGAVTFVSPLYTGCKICLLWQRFYITKRSLAPGRILK